MKAIKEMNLENAKLVRAEVEKKLADLEELLGVKFSYGNGKYSSSSFEFKVIANVASENDADLSSEELKYANNLKSLDAYGGFLGIKSEHIGKEIEISRIKFVIIGLSSKRSNASVIGRGVNGKLFKLDINDVIKALK